MIIFCQVVVRLRAGEIIIVFIRATYQTAVLFIIEQLQGGRFGRVEPLVKTAPHRRVVVHRRPGRRGAPYVISRKKGNWEGDAELLLAQPHDQFVRLGGNNLIPQPLATGPLRSPHGVGKGRKPFWGFFDPQGGSKNPLSYSPLPALRGGVGGEVYSRKRVE